MSYQSEIDNFIAHATKNLLQVVKEVASQTHLYAIDHSPFDTGRLKSSWNITEGDTPNLDATPELGGRRGRRWLPGDQPLTMEQAEGVSIQQQGNLASLTTPVVTISNNVPYVLFLELGTVHIAPFYMLTGAKNNFQVYVDQAARGLTI